MVLDDMSRVYNTQKNKFSFSAAINMFFPNVNIILRNIYYTTKISHLCLINGVVAGCFRESPTQAINKAGAENNKVHHQLIIEVKFLGTCQLQFVLLFVNFYLSV